MKFMNMGSADASHEVERFGTNTMKSEIKGATIRTTEDFLDLLNIVCAKAGFSRQAFMSKVVEEMSVQAIAEYLIGYGSYFGQEISVHDYFKGVEVPEKIKPEFDAFCEAIADYMIDQRAFTEGLKALDNDHPAKIAHKKKAQRDVLRQFPDAVFENNLLTPEEIAEIKGGLNVTA